MMSGSEICPYCGRNIIKGAMKCMGCGKILKTPEEQMRSYEKQKASQETSIFTKVIKFVLLVLLILAAGVVYKLYGDQIRQFISVFLKR